MTAPIDRQKNQAEYWNQRQKAAALLGPDAVAAVWYDACRMVARQSQKHGDTEVWNRLASHLHDFFQHHKA
ncbi:hypothetical protein ABZ953_06795 [Streptomyces sp. NPDC046465]|uniref:hypothetical protein n=1 Tax=Streptomyces sp. NPDC046465 TaxID=3155810 RepID=UPI0033F2DD15